MFNEVVMNRSGAVDLSIQGAKSSIVRLNSPCATSREGPCHKTGCGGGRGSGGDGCVIDDGCNTGNGSATGAGTISGVVTSSNSTRLHVGHVLRPPPVINQHRIHFKW